MNKLDNLPEEVVHELSQNVEKFVEKVKVEIEKEIKEEVSKLDNIMCRHQTPQKRKISAKATPFG